MTETQIDLRQIAPHQRHPLIFNTFDQLPVGGSLALTNDHDPRPLFHQLKAERPGTFSWTYLEEGPELWRMRITKDSAPPADSSGNCCGHCGG
jgi:uncharacterized protein (DUF2249 family)